MVDCAVDCAVVVESHSRVNEMLTLSDTVSGVRNTAGMLMMCGVLVAGCGGGSDDEAVTTPPTDPVPETTAPTTTVAPTTTTTTTVPETTTTAAPSLTANGLIWNSGDPDLINAFDDQPTAEYEGITSFIDSALVFSIDDLDECREQSLAYQQFHGGDLAEQCLVVTWRFDVAEDLRVDENVPGGGIGLVNIVTVDGQEVFWPSNTLGLPGSVDNTATVTFPFGGAGSTIGWEIGSDLVGRTGHFYTLPDELPLVVVE